MKFVLLVTWIVSRQVPPSSYQTTFNSAEACEAARNAVLAEGRRLKNEYYQNALTGTGGNQQQAAFFSIGAPTVSAVCAAQ
jgi:hypothetical protein